MFSIFPDIPDQPHQCYNCIQYSCPGLQDIEQYLLTFLHSFLIGNTSLMLQEARMIPSHVERLTAVDV